MDQINGYYCLSGELIGLNNVETISNPCKSDSGLTRYFELSSDLGNVFLECKSDGNIAVHKCADFLFWNQEYSTCTIDKYVHEIDQCKKSPCKNKGKCQNLGDNKSRCVCEEGFTGSLCEIVIDYCSASPCGDEGRCVPHYNGYNCVCANNVVDESCETRKLKQIECKICLKIFIFSCLKEIANPCVDSLVSLVSYPLANTKYILCGAGGFAFVKSCPWNLIWDDKQKTCIHTDMTSLYLDSDNADHESDVQMQLYPEALELFDPKNGTDPKTTFKTKINIKINFLNMNLFKPTKKGIRVRICSSSKCIF